MQSVFRSRLLMAGSTADQPERAAGAIDEDRRRRAQLVKQSRSPRRSDALEADRELLMRGGVFTEDA